MDNVPATQKNKYTSLMMTGQRMLNCYLVFPEITWINIVQGQTNYRYIDI